MIKVLAEKTGLLVRAPNHWNSMSVSV